MESLQRKAGGLYAAQFLGSFNDYAWKMIVTLLLQRGLVGPDAATEAQARATLVTLWFLLPLTLGALPSISICDRFSKRSVIVATKWAEFALMAAATLSLWFEPSGGSVALLLVAAILVILIAGLILLRR